MIYKFELNNQAYNNNIISIIVQIKLNASPNSNVALYLIRISIR